MSLEATQAKLIVAMTALSKIANGPSFAGRSAEQSTAKTALDTIRALSGSTHPENIEGD